MLESIWNYLQLVTKKLCQNMKTPFDHKISLFSNTLFNMIGKKNFRSIKVYRV